MVGNGTTFTGTTLSQIGSVQLCNTDKKKKEKKKKSSDKCNGTTKRPGRILAWMHCIDQAD